MESQQTSQGKPSKGKGKANDKGNDKEKQSRRLWTLKEKEVLLVCMLEEFKDGVKWKAGNGFKSGFFGAVEILFHKMLPGTTIRATPNIESKVKNWKEKYGLLADMQRLSGFSWNHDTNSVIVDSPDVWEDYVKFHPKANGMNGKAFPMYPGWTILFGKDRATDEMAEDPPEIRDDDWEEEIDQVWHEESVVGTNDCYTPRFANGEFVFGGGGSSFIDLSAGGSQPANPSTPTSNDNAKNLELEMEDMLTANAMILASEERVDEFYSVPESFSGCFAAVFRAVLLQFSGMFVDVLWAVLLHFYEPFCCSFWAILWAVSLQFLGLFCCSFKGCFAAVFWHVL
ncbi:hypothetical protein Vadar_026470 [Vaccinium darrowii]|uniref:Uncharacterized protein n=1 Tax=Vaccinium darrowii TaxID=229202 RepID=A0ACB7XU35_9ERIC|nr:hypothetical protein Vadar_026470 [Vaccinium darrowii]